MLAYLFLILVGVVIPILAYFGRRQIADGISIPRGAVYVQALVSQLLIGGLAFVVAWRTHTSVLHWFQLDRDPRLAAAAALLLAVAVVAMLLGLRSLSKMERRIFELLAPATRNESLAWVGLCAVVAVVEEFVYRAVLPDVLQQFNDEPLFIIAASALVFGLAHLLQGWKGFAVTALFAIPLHILVYLSGTITAAIVVHFLYDLLAGFAIRRRLSSP